MNKKKLKMISFSILFIMSIILFGCVNLKDSTIMQSNHFHLLNPIKTHLKMNKEAVRNEILIPSSINIYNLETRIVKKLLTCEVESKYTNSILVMQIIEKNNKFGVIIMINHFMKNDATIYYTSKLILNGEIYKNILDNVNFYKFDFITSIYQKI